MDAHRSNQWNMGSATNMSFMLYGWFQSTVSNATKLSAMFGRCTPFSLGRFTVGYVQCDQSERHVSLSLSIFSI